MENHWADFELAAETVKTLDLDKVKDDQKLKLYGLFKQAKEGDINTSKPGIFDPKGRAKWDAWNANKGKSKEDCAKDYVKLVIEIKGGPL